MKRPPKFQVVYSYYMGVPNKQVHGQTWCDDPKEAKDKIYKVIPKRAKILEAWFCEWGAANAPIEQLMGHQKDPHKELVRMVKRNIQERGKNLKGKPRIKIPAPLQEIATDDHPTTVCFVPPTTYWATSARDVAKANSK